MEFDFGELWQVTLRALLSLVTLFLVTKMLGKKQVSQLSLFDYVIGISIGNFAAEMTINLDSHYLHGTAAVIIFGVVAYLISYVTMKSIFLRRYFMGVPSVLIENGHLIEKAMKKVKFDLNDLLEECRNMGYFDISEIAYAIMEANGQLSILPKGEHKPVTVQDLNLQAKTPPYCANVIIDGKIMKNNLKNMKKDESWLRQQLKVKGKDLPNILLATLDQEDKLQIYERGYESMGGILE